MEGETKKEMRSEGGGKSGKNLRNNFSKKMFLRGQFDKIILLLTKNNQKKYSFLFSFEFIINNF